MSTDPRHKAVTDLPFNPSPAEVRGALLAVKQAYLGAELSSLDALTTKSDLTLLLKGKGFSAARDFVRDALSDIVKKEPDTKTSGAGTSVVLNDPKPWDEVVDGAKWLEEVAALLHGHLILPEHAAETVALWVLFSYAIDVMEFAPLLVVTSPTKRCGKTRLLDLLGMLCRRALSASNVTAAAFYRAIELYAPTFVIDEADAFLHEREELRGVINSGFGRANAYVMRTVGDDHLPSRFSTWGAKAIAKIGGLSGKWTTVEDRSIVIRMRRRKKEEVISRRLPKATSPQIERLVQQAQRWAQDNSAALALYEMPEISALDDRAEDRWSPLFSVAEQAGGGWPEKVRAAALALSGEVEEGGSVGEQLLLHVKAWFDKFGDRTRVHTEVLLAWLNSNPEWPWGKWNRRDGLTGKELGRLLGGFGVKREPDPFEEGGTRARGYSKAAFTDAWETYGGSTPGQRLDLGGGLLPEPKAD